MAVEYLETYRKTCDYFYLAAKKFSSSTLDLEGIGLFDLTRKTVIKNAEYLSPEPVLRADLMKRIKNNFRVLTNVVDDPFQRTILPLRQMATPLSIKIEISIWEIAIKTIMCFQESI